MVIIFKNKLATTNIKYLISTKNYLTFCKIKSFQYISPHCVFFIKIYNFYNFIIFLFFKSLFTVRDGDTVKHYRIRQLDEGGFFIARRTTFRYVNSNTF